MCVDFFDSQDCEILDKNELILIGNQETGDKTLSLESRLTLSDESPDSSRSLKSQSKYSTSTVARSEVTSKTSSKGSHVSEEAECDLSQYVRFPHIAITFAS
jgi:hypothetical protein